MRTRAMAAAATTAAPAPAPPASPSKRPLGKWPPQPSPRGSSGRRRQRIGPHPRYGGSTICSSTASSARTGGSMSILHRLPAPALAFLPTLLPTASLLAAASADRASAALLGEVTRLRLTAAPLVRDPAAAGATAAMQIAGLLRRCTSLRRLEGPFHHQGLQQSVGQALALLPTAPRNIEALVAASSSSSSPSPMGPALRRSRLWFLYAHQQRPAAPALLEAAGKGRLPGLKRLDLGALGVPYLDDSAGPTAAAAAMVFGQLGQGVWPGLSAVVLGPGVYTDAAASPSASLAEGVVEALARRRALAVSGAVAPLEELRFQRLRDYGEEDEHHGVGGGGDGGGHWDGQQQHHHHHHQSHHNQQHLQQLQQLRVHAEPHEHAHEDGEDEEEGQWQEEDENKENTCFFSSFASAPASPRTPGLLPAADSPFSSPCSSPRPSSTSSSAVSSSASAATAADVDAGADWRLVEGVLATGIDAKVLRVLEVTGGCARKSQRWGKAVARLLGSNGGGGCPALRELALTPDAAFGSVAAALGEGTAAPGLKRFCLKAPEALDGATAAGSLRPPVLPSAAVRALGAAFEQGGLAGLASLSLDGAAEGAAVAALLTGMMGGSARGGSARALEELLLPLPLQPESDDGGEEDGGAAATAPLLLALAACLRAGCLPSLRRLRLPVTGAIKPGGGAWGALLGALAGAPLEDVVLVEDGDVDEGEDAVSALACAVQGVLPGAVVTWC